MVCTWFRHVCTGLPIYVEVEGFQMSGIRRNILNGVVFNGVCQCAASHLTLCIASLLCCSSSARLGQNSVKLSSMSVAEVRLEVHPSPSSIWNPATST